MLIFEKTWMEELQGRYPSFSSYTAPYIVKLAFDPVFSWERNKIESWFSELPDGKLDVCRRLRSENPQQHFGAYNELLLYKFLKSQGFSVTVYPELYGSQPDLLVTREDFDTPIIIEVATIFDDPFWQKEQNKFNAILAELDKISHYFLITVVCKSEPLPEKVDYDKLKNFVIAWLDSFDPKTTHDTHEIQYESDGLKLGFLLSPIESPHKTSIVGGHMLPARWIGSSQLEQMLQRKIKKYKMVKKLKWPFIVAINLEDTMLDKNNILEVLFGKMTFQYQLATNIAQNPTGKWKRDYSGLLTPKPGLGGIIRNTRLSAVLCIDSKWSRNTVEELKAHKEFRFTVIHNPFASITLNNRFLEGWPHFVISEQYGTTISLDWINKDSNLLFS